MLSFLTFPTQHDRRHNNATYQRLTFLPLFLQRTTADHFQKESSFINGPSSSNDHFFMLVAYPKMQWENTSSECDPRFSSLSVSRSQISQILSNQLTNSW